MIDQVNTSNQEFSALAQEEKTQSPKMKRLLDGHVAEVDAVHDGAITFA